MKRLVGAIVLMIAALNWAAAQHTELNSRQAGYDFTVDGVNYGIVYKRVSDSELRMTDTVEVRIGSMIPADGHRSIPAEVEFGGRRYIVGIIDFDAFQNREELKSLSLPPTITFIGSRAFSGCQNLEDINIPNGVEELLVWTFRYCKKLTEVELPPSVKKIEDGAFDESGIKYIELPQGTNRIIGWVMFGLDHNLDYIKMPASVSVISDLKCKVVDYYGNGFKVEYIIKDTKCKYLLLHTVTPFNPFGESKKKYMLKFAKGCTVYVPDEAVAVFRAHPEWQLFKAVKPLSDYKK